MALKNRIRNLAILFFFLFLLPVINLTRFQVLQAEELNNAPKNQRQLEDLDKRGRFLDRHNRVLAETKHGQRYYPLADATGSLIGYLTPRLGDAGLESAFKKETRGMTIPRNPWEALVQIRKGSRQGDDVVLTLDATLQSYAYECLAGYRGAIVVIDVEKGELLALASRPSYDPNPEPLAKEWKKISQDSSSPLLERCTEGRYPAGSTFKVLIMAGALEDGLTNANETINCTGKMNVGNFVLNCNGIHGIVNLQQALTYSCNMMFANLGLKLGIEGIQKWMDRFGMGEALPLVPGATAALQPTSSVPSSAAEAAIGQADTLVSPLQMARVAATVSRGGIDLQPRLIKAITRRGQIEEQPAAAKPSTVISPETAKLLEESMVEVINSGTGGAAALPGIQVAGKTGSAENPHGQTHAWFIGYAPVGNPRIAVAVLLENAGGGGRYAAPVAQKILAKALESNP